jgi:hypothetical protein
MSYAGALQADSARHRTGGTLSVGQAVRVRRSGAVGVVRALNPDACTYLVGLPDGPVWMSRLRLDLVIS